MIPDDRPPRDLIVTIPGISINLADVIIAETGADMTRFPTAGHLASWAGTCPGSNESAGRIKSTHTRPGNPYLKAALGVAAMSASRSKDTYLAAKYGDPGEDFFTRLNPDRAKNRALDQLRRMGYAIIVSPLAASA